MRGIAATGVIFGDAGLLSAANLRGGWCCDFSCTGARKEVMWSDQIGKRISYRPGTVKDRKRCTKIIHLRRSAPLGIIERKPKPAANDVTTNLVLPLDQSTIAEIDSLASFQSRQSGYKSTRTTTAVGPQRCSTWRQALEFSSIRGSTGTSVPQVRMRHGVSAGAVRHNGHVGHAGNGDSMLAYHLMDFSRYFFDQSNICC